MSPLQIREEREQRTERERERACAGHTERERERFQVQRANDLQRRGALMGVVQRESVEK